MPRYTYRCENCEDVFEVVHSMSEELFNCTACNNIGTLVRIPSRVQIKAKESEEKVRKVGSITKEFIEQARENLKEQKKEAKQKVYKQ